MLYVLLLVFFLSCLHFFQIRKLIPQLEPLQIYKEDKKENNKDLGHAEEYGHFRSVCV